MNHLQSEIHSKIPTHSLARFCSLVLIAAAAGLLMTSQALARSSQQEASQPEVVESTDSGSSTKLMALVGGQVHTMELGGVIQNATILIKDGKIQAVGSEIEVPADAIQVDVSGMIVTPGLIDVRSRLWLTPASANQSASDGSLDAVNGVDIYSSYASEV